MKFTDRLNADKITERLNDSLPTCEIKLYDTVTSTNTLAKQLAEQGAKEGTVIIADSQTAGKGRLGRKFSSPSGTGLYISIILRPKFSAEQALSITTAAAVATANAIETVTDKKAMIKWVNDIYVDGCKVCGILTEGSTDFKTGKLNYAVLGIGVNVSTPNGGFPEEIKEIAGALYKTDAPGNTRNSLAAEILNNFFAYYEHLTERTFLSEYKARSLLNGVKITFALGDEKYAGIVEGIDDECALVVRLSNGRTQTFSAGEISVEKDFLAQIRAQKEGGTDR